MIVFSLPDFFETEVETITMMFQSGLKRFHLRKPASTIEQVRGLLDAIPRAYHERIVIHDHFELLNEYQLCGIHLNRRNPEIPEGWEGHVSISCHSLEELQEKKKSYPYQYLSLSPIFNSISKKGYNSAFTHSQLLQAKQQDIIDERVVALGGISWENAEKALEYGFGDVMILGDAWKNLQEPLPVVLSIAGSDPSAGAGIQQDLKTITNLGCYAATVITAVTAQNTIGVQKVAPVDTDTVEAQINAVFSDMRVAAVKLGMIPNVQIAKVIINSIKREQKRRILPVVCDPVMFSTSGIRLMDEDCIHFIANELFPLCSLITPNIPEYEYLQQISAGNVNMRAFLLKGGHGNGPEMTDTLFLTEENREVSYSQQKIESTNLHGTGCTLSSAIASGLAKGLSLENAVANAKSYITKAIQGGKDLHLGHGNGPLWYKILNI